VLLVLGILEIQGQSDEARIPTPYIPSGPTVTMPGMGTVEGKSRRRSVLLKRNFDIYLGIPFGKPPSGPLRYKVKKLRYDVLKIL
jgi:hypothetical protein